MKSLVEQVAEFMYTHMAQAPNRKELLKLVETAEFHYIVKIHELEKKLFDIENPVLVTRWDDL
jgi:hypothetical protein